MIPLDGQRVEALTLEIADGDDARLTVTSVQGRVALPRLVFKAAAGSYRVLLGNAEAAAPRYDLSSLRQEVLSYSARPVQASAMQANPEFRRSAGEYFRGAPPTALLWGTLVVAVVALLLLTVRVLRAAPAVLILNRTQPKGRARSAVVAATAQRAVEACRGRRRQPTPNPSPSVSCPAGPFACRASSLSIWS